MPLTADTMALDRLDELAATTPEALAHETAWRDLLHTLGATTGATR